MPEIDKAKHFKSLHVAGNPLVVYNIWDAGSAMCLAQQGATAIATGSLSVGASQGFADGEVIPLQRALETAQQIAQSVDIPVSLDFEGGYARDPETLKANIKAVIATGVVGINLEDQIVKGTGLYALTEQVARLKAVRHAAEQQGMPLFLNARTDKRNPHNIMKRWWIKPLNGLQPLPRQAPTDFSFPASRTLH